jgi:hypothetical protein
MNIDGKRLTENQRMALLRAEEHEALGMWEIPSNALISARLSLHPQTIASLPGEEVSREVAAPNSHQEPAHSPHIGESGLHELIEFASLAKVMG